MVLGLQESCSGTLLFGRLGEVAFDTRPGNRKSGAGNAVANRDVIAFQAEHRSAGTADTAVCHVDNREDPPGLIRPVGCRKVNCQRVMKDDGARRGFDPDRLGVGDRRIREDVVRLRVHEVGDIDELVEPGTV
jgi:hypothetical protein